MVYRLAKFVWRHVVVADVAPADLFDFVVDMCVRQLAGLARPQSLGPDGRYTVLHVHKLLLLCLLPGNVVLEAIWIWVLYSHRALRGHRLLLQVHLVVVERVLLLTVLELHVSC